MAKDANGYEVIDLFTVDAELVLGGCSDCGSFQTLQATARPDVWVCADCASKPTGYKENA